MPVSVVIFDNEYIKKGFLRDILLFFKSLSKKSFSSANEYSSPKINERKRHNDLS
jgi:hypothetical protein